MGFGTAWKSWREGKGFSDSMSYLFVSETEIARGQALDTRLDAINRQHFDAGTYTAEQYAQASANAAQGNTQNWITGPETSPWVGFQEGAAEGLAAEKAMVQKATSGLIGNALGFIPWQVWVAAAIYVAWQLGWLRVIAGKVKQ